METESIGGSRYFFTLIDDYSKKVFVYFLKQKTEVPQVQKLCREPVRQKN